MSLVLLPPVTAVLALFIVEDNELVEVAGDTDTDDDDENDDILSLFGDEESMMLLLLALLLIVLLALLLVLLLLLSATTTEVSSRMLEKEGLMVLACFLSFDRKEKKNVMGNGMKGVFFLYENE